MSQSTPEVVNQNLSSCILPCRLTQLGLVLWLILSRLAKYAIGPIESSSRLTRFGVGALASFITADNRPVRPSRPTVPSDRPVRPSRPTVPSDPDPRSPGLSPQMSRSQCPIVPVPQSGFFFQKTLHVQEGEILFFLGTSFFTKKKGACGTYQDGGNAFFLGTSFFTTKKAPAAHTRSGCKTLEKSGQNTKGVLMNFFFH